MEQGVALAEGNPIPAPPRAAGQGGGETGQKWAKNGLARAILVKLIFWHNYQFFGVIFLQLLFFGTLFHLCRA